MHAIFNPKGPTIPVKLFRNTMTSIGEKLTNEELDELFKELKMEKEDNFNYEEFIRAILTRWLIDSLIYSEFCNQNNEL